MSSNDNPDLWHIEKKVPIALVFSMLLQGAGLMTRSGPTRSSRRRSARRPR
jgi:hypothetical protein